MKRTIVLLIAISFGLALGGCGMFKKNKKSEPAKAAPAMKAEPAKKAAPAPAKKKKRIRCSSKKTYKQNTPCWHWKKSRAKKAKK